MTHVWHKYPEDKPIEDDYYFVTLSPVSIGNDVRVAFFVKYEDEAEGSFELFGEDRVVAWAEINYPEPYRQIKKKSRRKREQL